MAEMIIMLRRDPNTGKQNIIIKLDSDPDALPIEHEQMHKALVEKLIGKGVKLDAASGKYVPNDVKVDAATYYNGLYNASNNEAFMYDETYVKLREVRVGYTFRHFLGKSSPAGLNVSLIGRNLLEFTQNKDVDPETLALRGQQILPGTEFLSIPSTRSMGISVGVNF